MEVVQKTIELEPFKRGFHLITENVLSHLPELNRFKQGVVHIFIQHTSASLSINENADPTVRQDLENFSSKLIPESRGYYSHDYEGADDMPAHIKNVLIGSSLSIPVTNGQLNLGTWQGIYLCEHRSRGGRRRLVVTIIGAI